MVLLSILQEESMEVVQYLSALFTLCIYCKYVALNHGDNLELEILVLLKFCCFHIFFILTIVCFPLCSEMRCPASISDNFSVAEG
jgi:hypothetical protein